jgi:GNAT superfamily N-acetyltransferase
MEIRTISAEEARPLRAAILRPGVPFEASVYPLDQDHESIHMGAFEADRLITVASIFHEPPPGETNPQAWRLRGMGTRPEVQRRGYGRAVLEECIAQIARRGATLLWCNARLDAVEFYRRLGFETVGEEEKTQRGTSYIRMRRTLSPKDIRMNRE